MSTFACIGAIEVDIGALTVDIRTSTFLIRRVDDPTSTDVGVDVRASMVDIRALTIDQSSAPVLYHANVMFFCCICLNVA